MTPPGAAATRAARTPAGHARDKILSTAFRLFYAHGLRAAGIDTIIAESGVAKATFYKYFPAKDDLILAYLEKVDGIWTGQLHAAAEAAGFTESGDETGVRGGVVHVLSEFRDWRDKAPHRQKQRGDKRKDSAKYLDFTDHRWIV